MSLMAPSFTRNSDGNLAAIAARVVEEFKAAEQGHGGEMLIIGEAEKEVKSDFEFTFAPREMAFSPISADEIFCNGQIRPTFPVHRRNVSELQNGNSNSVPNSKNGVERVKAGRLTLRKLLAEDRENLSSCSSSETDELVSVPAEKYCVWRPKSPEEPPSPGSYEKCNSTRSTKLWKLRDLLYRRSNSAGKDAFVFLTSSLKKRQDKKVITTGATNPAGK